MHLSLVRRAGRLAHSRPAATALVAAGLLVAGCGAGDTPSAPATVSETEDNGSGFRGTTLPEPMPLTDAAASAVFSTAAGGTTTLGELQQDRVMLVFFGYTHCPDVCPTTMADLGIALQRAPEDVQQQTQVAFITSDPERDTPAVLADWLDHFDSGLGTPFVGLTASPEQVTAVAESMGVSLSPPQVGSDGTVTVEHGVQTLAFVDGRAGLVWTSSSTSEDYRADLARLVGDL